jgi:hypothetical protein
MKGREQNVKQRQTWRSVVEDLLDIFETRICLRFQLLLEELKHDRPERLGPSGKNHPSLTSTTASMPPQDTLRLAPEADDPLEYEQRYVHEVYDTIADHFSATRYKVRA